MTIVFLSVLVVLSATYFAIVRPRIKTATGKKPRGWNAIDEELPYIAVFLVLASGLSFFAAVVFYFFDLGIEVSAADVRHGIYTVFLSLLFIAFFAFFVPRVLHFRYNTLTFSKPPPDWGALFLIISSFVAIWPFLKYVAGKITEWSVAVWSFIT